MCKEANGLEWQLTKRGIFVFTFDLTALDA